MLTAYAHFSAPNKSSFGIRLLMSVQRQVGSPNQAWAGPVSRKGLEQEHVTSTNLLFSFFENLSQNSLLVK